MYERLANLEDRCRVFIETGSVLDTAHYIYHVKRVVENAKIILSRHPADAEIVLPSAWLHDCVVLAKDHPNRKKASHMAAIKATDFLREAGYPNNKLDAVSHAIIAHSYTADVKPQTMEAKIVQDADRLDALGAIGIARCIIVGAKLKRPLYNDNDPFCTEREPDDTKWTIDHFYTKLFKLPGLMHTDTAKEIAEKRLVYMREYLDILKEEITIHSEIESDIF
jgi:uncharacterized protein